MERYIDLLPTTVSLVALILGVAIGWLVARSRFATTIAELNGKLVLERRVNKQLSETVQVQADAVPRFIQTANLTPSGEPTREPMALSG
jgi:uncharacterized membrane-anchored protein YhcB (DUF1043 family)